MNDDAIEHFMSVAGCDREFAASFLEANGWHLESAVNNFMDPGTGHNSTTGLPPGMSSSSLGDNPAHTDASFNALRRDLEHPRAPIAQFRDTLIDSDPAQHVPPPLQAAQNHPLEAFRANPVDSDIRVGADDAKDFFGLQKRPRNLAEIYAAPIEICFAGTFDELRAAGRRQQKWLLINIQSPTEFASQQLNADTWRDETLRMVLSASFLFWQQYYDSPEGATYCRFYLPSATHATPPTGLPHIAVVDPITASTVKTWTGFKDAERLMDKLMEYADDPPKDLLEGLPDSGHPGFSQQLSPPKSTNSGQLAASASVQKQHSFGQENVVAADAGELAVVAEPESATAIAASLENRGARLSAASASASPRAQERLSDENMDAMWGTLRDEPAQGILLKIRTLSGAQIIRRFTPSSTFRDILAAVHFAGHRLDATKQYKLSAPFGASMTDQASTLEAVGMAQGAYNLSEC